MPTVFEGLPAFAAYFVMGALILTAFAAIYVRITPHSEIALIRAGNSAAALAFGATIFGFSMPLASAISNTVALGTATVWSLIGCAVQLLAYGVARLVVPDISARIARGDMAAAIWVAAVSLTAGSLNAACMSY